MRKLLLDTCYILNRNCWLLFLFITVSYVGLIYFYIIGSAANSGVELLIGVITLLFIAVAGVAGIFHTMRSIIDAHYSHRETSRLDLLKTFPKGVSGHFFPALGLILIYLAIAFLMFNLVVILGKNLIGMFSFTAEDLSKALTSFETLAEFQKNLSLEDVGKLTRWHALYFAVTLLMTYLLIYWLPETFYNTKNPLLSLVRAIKKVLVMPLKTLQLLVTVIALNFLISIVMALMMKVQILTYLVSFVYFYGLLYVFMLIFNFYRENFVIPEFTAELVEEEVTSDGTDEE